jgi:hypothetical protein
MGALVLLAATATAGSLRGRVELVEKGGRERPTADVVVWVEGPVKPDPRRRPSS